MEINLITQNKNKVREFKQILEPEIKVNHLDFDYPELRSDDPIDIVKIAAKSLAEKLNKPIVVEDSGFFIESLNGFPGTCTAYSHKRIGNEGILKVMEKNNKRKCHYKSAIGFCKPGEEPIGILGQEEGIVSLQIQGENGWGQDPIFIPSDKSLNNSDQLTYGQLRKGDKSDTNLFRQRSIQKFKEILSNHRE